MRVNKIGIFIIVLALAFLIFVAITSEAKAQTFVGAGASVIRSSSYDPSPNKRKDGGSIFGGAYVEGGYDLRHGLQARFLGEYQTESSFNSIFTSDSNTGRVATSELRLRAGLRYKFYGASPVRPFVEGGVDYFRQFFKSTEKPEPIPLPVPAYVHGEEYGNSVPSAGLNPYLSVGAAFGEYHELAYSHLFTDTTSLNNSQLRGHRLNYSYTRPLFGRVSLKAAGEVDYVTFRDAVGDYIAFYDKHDTVIRARLGFTFGGSK